MNKYFYWLDLETTGLDERTCSILEVAAVVTDLEFNVLEEFTTVVKQSPEVLASMNEWCKKNHGESGLTKEVPYGMPLSEAEGFVHDLFRKYQDDQKVVLSGNTIDFDQRFIRVHMKKLESILHYRKMDVSSFKEYFFQKHRTEMPKKCAHRALPDIHESIQEMKLYDRLIRKGMQ